MKTQIRYGVFETNSSMSNALTIMNKDEYEDLLKKEESDEWVWDIDNERFIRAEDVPSEWCIGWDYRSSFFDDESECVTKRYTTKSGDEIVVISQVRYDY